MFISDKIPITLLFYMKLPTNIIGPSISMQRILLASYLRKIIYVTII
jgi:hypothetical protein